MGDYKVLLNTCDGKKLHSLEDLNAMQVDTAQNKMVVLFFRFAFFSFSFSLTHRHLVLFRKTFPLGRTEGHQAPEREKC